MLDCTIFNNGEQCILAWKCWPAIYVVKELEICMPVQAVNLRVVDSVSSSSKEMERVPCVIDTHMLQI